MSETIIKTVAEFHEELRQLKDKTGFIYRGQSNAKWPVDCSAARRLKKHSADKIEEQLIDHLLIGYLKFLIAKARMRGFIPSGLSEISTDLELLAQLQHQGAATGLMDFTHQPLVALWFACNESNEKDGIVYALSSSKTKEINDREDLEKEIQSFYGEDKLWLWEPPALGNRIVAQSSVLVFGVSTIPLTEMEKFVVKVESKRDILTQLETIYGLSEEALFSDFPGYAVANASNKTFDTQRAIRYWLKQIELASDNSEKAQAYFHCGVAYSAIKDFEKAIEQYGRVIQIDPNDAVTYYNRGLAKAKLGKYDEAIADYDIAIKINLKFTQAYYNRANAKTALGDFDGAIVDCGIAIKINPNYAQAYNSRGLAKVNLGKLNKAISKLYSAIADYNEAIKINPSYAEAYNNRGLAKTGVGDFDGAIDDYDKAIKINPSYAQAYLGRGLAWKQKKVYDKARQDWETAIELALQQGRQDIVQASRNQLGELPSDGE